LFVLRVGKQIPCGNDNKRTKAEDKRRSRFPAGMTTKEQKQKTKEEADSLRE
jgi:hypothetical protein